VPYLIRAQFNFFEYPIPNLKIRKKHQFFKVFSDVIDFPEVQVVTDGEAKQNVKYLQAYKYVDVISVGQWAR